MTLNKILSKTAYSAYDKKKYRHDYFCRKTGGYLIVERERITQSLMNKQEKAKFKREYAMCLTLAKNGYAVEYLKDKPKSYDILLMRLKLRSPLSGVTEVRTFRHVPILWYKGINNFLSAKNIYPLCVYFPKFYVHL